MGPTTVVSSFTVHEDSRLFPFPLGLHTLHQRQGDSHGHANGGIHDELLGNEFALQKRWGCRRG